jgi:hypothetical protein
MISNLPGAILHPEMLLPLASLTFPGSSCEQAWSCTGHIGSQLFPNRESNGSPRYLRWFNSLICPC